MYVDPTGEYFLPVAINPSDPTLGGNLFPPTKAEFGSVHTPKALSKADKTFCNIYGALATGGASYGLAIANPTAVATGFNTAVNIFFTAEGTTAVAGTGTVAGVKAVTRGNKARNAAVQGAQQFKNKPNFTSGNFRQNLIKETGTNPGRANHAHHIFPQKFIDKFSETSINVNNPKYGSWWPAKDHLKNAYNYNKVWKEFLKEKPSISKILDKGTKMAKEYGLKINF